METAIENFRRMMSRQSSRSPSSSPAALAKTTSTPVSVTTPLEAANSESDATQSLPRPSSEGGLAPKLAEEAAVSAVESLPTPANGSTEDSSPVPPSSDSESVSVTQAPEVENQDVATSDVATPVASKISSPESMAPEPIFSTPGSLETPLVTPGSAAPAIRAPLTATGEDGEDEDDADDATSYGSADERGTGSAGSLQQSPSAEFVDLSGTLTAAQAALVRLNELAGSALLSDRSLLEGVDEDGFRSRVKGIALKNNMSADSPQLQNIVNELLPVVKEVNQNALDDASNGMMNGAISNGDVGRPVARLTTEDEKVDDSRAGDEHAMDEEEDDDAMAVEEGEYEGREEDEANQGEEDVPETIEGLRVRADRDAAGDEGGNDDNNEENGEDMEVDEDEDEEYTAEAFAALQRAMRANAGQVPTAQPTDQSAPQPPQGLGPGLANAVRRDGGGGSAATRPPPAAQPAAQAAPEAPAAEEDPEQKRIREKLTAIRVKLLRLASRLGQDHHNPVVAQVLYRLRLVEQMRSGGRPGGMVGANVEDAVRSASEVESAEGPDSNLDFSCTIMVIGKTGVGKSATINSLFDAGQGLSAYQPATTKVTEFISNLQGMRVRVIDTPGLMPAVSDQKRNEKILGRVKKYIKKSPPDIVLYVDRLDVQPAPFGDLPLLRTLTEAFGQALWFNLMVVFTHAAASPPDDARGNQMSYETYQAQRSYTVQQSIRQAAGDMRLMNPVALAENHPNCRTNRAGERVLPNGQVWRPQLLLLCFSSKILAEANALWRSQDAAGAMLRMGGGGGRTRSSTMPFLLSQLLQWHDPLRLPDDQMGAEEDELEEIFGDEIDEEDEDDLPPFNPLSKEQLAKLSSQQQQEYHEEVEDREKIFKKREFKASLRQRREMKRRAAEAKAGFTPEDVTAMEEEEEAQRNSSVPVAMPDLLLPPSFDSDNPVYRYRALETGTWLIRPLLEQHGWDHDAGYDAFSVERGLAIAGMPANINGQISKDKKDAQVALEAAISRWHGETGPYTPVTTAGLDVHTVGKDLAYTLHAGTRVSNLKRNKTGAGLALTILGDAITYGLKLEDRLSLGKRGKLTLATGMLKTRGDQVKGGNLEVTIHHSKDYPLDRSHTTFAATAMDWQGEIALGANVQTSFSVGKTSLTCRSNLNNRGAGQISVRAHSNEQMYMALIGLVPIAQHFIGTRLLGHHG